jgi:hypothetical protein
MNKPEERFRVLAYKQVNHFVVVGCGYIHF